MTVTEIPRALHLGEEDAPFVDLGNGVELQVLKIDIEAGLWVIRNRFQPGLVVERHKHTGCVHAFTRSGSWKYLEYPEVNRAGSYLFEPAGSVHTLIVPEDNTEVTDVWFAIQGANLNLDENDEIQMVIDAALIRDVYLGACEAAGLPRPPVIGV
jgi:quercetin dioxygenase-like cupin family protein